MLDFFGKMRDNFDKMIAILKDKKGFVKSMDIFWQMPEINIAIVPGLTELQAILMDDMRLEVQMPIIQKIRFYMVKMLDEQVALYQEE